MYSGVLYDIHNKNKAKWITKFESIMNLEYNIMKIFKDEKKIDYEDAYIKMKGDLIKNRLYGVNNSETIRDRIIIPSIKIYEKY